MNDTPKFICTHGVVALNNNLTKIGTEKSLNQEACSDFVLEDGAEKSNFPTCSRCKFLKEQTTILAEQE